MIDSYTIVREDAQVALDDAKAALDAPAATVLDMLCEAMQALTLGNSADGIVCTHLGRGLRADAAVTIAIEQGRPQYVVSCYPKTISVQSIAEDLLARHLQSGEEKFCVEYIEGVGHVASMWIQPTELGGIL